MIKAYSQKLSPPYSGQVQIAESERARAITMDGENWEIHFLTAMRGDHPSDQGIARRSFRRAAYIRHDELSDYSRTGAEENPEIDERITELTNFLTTTSLPFPAADRYEYWLLDHENDAPLALIFSCTEAEYMNTFPQRPEWTALPAAVMPIQSTEAEISRGDPPVNYRLERLVETRAGRKPRARWFNRRPEEPDTFPALMINEHWAEDHQRELCQRYIQRQSTRLLMLHSLSHTDRLRMEQAAKAHIFEVDRFFRLYPDVADPQLMNSIRVEARLRSSSNDTPSLHNRRDGVLYI